MELREAFPPGTNIQRPERGLLRMAVLGPPEVFHDGSRLTFSLRKAQALLLYLALVRYLGHFWKDHGSRVLLLGTVRRDQLELTPALSARLADLRRDLPITQVALQPLSREETLQLVESIVGEGEHGCRSGGEMREQVTAEVAPGGGACSAPGRGEKLWALGDWLFAHTGGQPLYLLETLKLFRDREWLVPRLGADGTWRLELVEMTPIVAQKRVERELVLPSARQLVMVSAVPGSRVSAQLLWQVAELGVQAGIEALEEAVKSGMLREEAAGGPGSSRLVGYSFSHELMREVVYTELGAARRQVLHQRALTRLQVEGVKTSELASQMVLA